MSGIPIARLDELRLRAQQLERARKTLDVIDSGSFSLSYRLVSAGDLYVSRDDLWQADAAVLSAIRRVIALRIVALEDELTQAGIDVGVLSPMPPAEAPDGAAGDDPIRPSTDNSAPGGPSIDEQLQTHIDKTLEGLKREEGS